MPSSDTHNFFLKIFYETVVVKIQGENKKKLLYNSCPLYSKWWYQ